MVCFGSLNFKFFIICAILVVEFFSQVVSYESDVHFYVFNRNCSDDAEIVSSLQDSKIFDINKDTKVLIHGFSVNCIGEFAVLNKNAFLKTMDCNVICVDWGVYAKFASTAVSKMLHVAEHIFSDLETNIDPKKVHFLGHSFGAQIAGLIGHFYRIFRNVLINQITALDPTRISMKYPQYNTTKLAPSCAKLVDVIHTDTVLVGSSLPYGHYDFYPNGGFEQPGCSNSFSCSHSRAHQISTRFILNPFAYPAQKCKTLELLEKRECDKPNGVYMGNTKTYNDPGIYYVETPDFNTESVEDLNEDKNLLNSNMVNTNTCEEQIAKATIRSGPKSKVQKHSLSQEIDNVEDDDLDLNSSSQQILKNSYFYLFDLLLIFFLHKIIRWVLF